MALTVTNECARHDVENFSPNVKSTIPKQRQLGLLRNNYTGDVIRTLAARQHTHGKISHLESSEPGNSRKTRRQMVNVLSREKLKMLQQIRKDNAQSSNLRMRQNTIRISSAPVSHVGQNPQGTFSYSNSRRLPTSQEMLASCVPKIHDKNQKKVINGLKNRSKYLPVLMNEFKKMQLNLGLGIYPNQTSADVFSQSHLGLDNSGDAMWSDVTCAAILSAIKSAREGRHDKMGSSAKTVRKLLTVQNGLKPSSCIPSFREFVCKRASNSSGANIAPGVVSVYNHVPAPPPRDYRVHWNNRPSADSILVTSLDSTRSRSAEVRKTAGDRPQGAASRGRSKTVPTWRRRGCQLKQESPEVMMSHPNDDARHFLLCSQINLARSRLANKDSLPHIDSRKNGEEILENDVNCREKREKIVRLNSALNSLPGSSDKRRRSVRFSNEKDKIFEYVCEDPIGPTPISTDESIANCRSTFELRGILDFSMKKC